MRVISFLLILFVISCSRREPVTVTTPIPEFIDIDRKGVSQLD